MVDLSASPAFILDALPLALCMVHGLISPLHRQDKYGMLGR